MEKTNSCITKASKIIVIAIIIFVLGILIYNFSPVIFQEGNPWPEIKGIAELTFGEEKLVKLSDSENKYLTKSEGGAEIIKLYMENNGYEFSEQMGSGYFFNSSDGNIIVAKRQYSRFYSIWEFSLED